MPTNTADPLVVAVLVDSIVHSDDPLERAESLRWLMDELCGIVDDQPLAGPDFDHGARLLVAELLADYRDDRAVQRIWDRTEAYRLAT